MNQIFVDLERVLSDIDRNVFGGYLENRVYGGIYFPDAPGADKDGLRSDMRDALARLKMANIRYGGNFFPVTIGGMLSAPCRSVRPGMTWPGTVLYRTISALMSSSIFAAS
jgi:alpha-N-arabinofuranosidase